MRRSIDSPSFVASHGAARSVFCTKERRRRIFIHTHSSVSPLTRCIRLHASLRSPLRDPRGCWSRSDRTRNTRTRAKKCTVIFGQSLLYIENHLDHREILRKWSKKFDKVYKSNKIKWNNSLKLWTIKTIIFSQYILIRKFYSYYFIKISRQWLDEYHSLNIIWMPFFNDF